MEPNTIYLRPTKVMRVLFAVALLLLLASVAGQFSRYLWGFEVRTVSDMFNINLERNFPTFFSMLLMLVASILLAIITLLSHQQKAPDVSKWAVLSLGFLFMSFDEGFQVHERFIEPVRSLLGPGDLGVFYYAWVVPALFLVAVLGLFFLRFVLRLPNRTRSSFLVAAGLFVGGALGVELLGGGYDEAYGYDNLGYNLIATVEEGLEMAGMVVFVGALFEYIGMYFGQVRFCRKCEVSNTAKSDV